MKPKKMKKPVIISTDAVLSSKVLLVFVHVVLGKRNILLGCVLFKRHAGQVPASAGVTTVNAAFGSVLTVALLSAPEHGLGFVLVAKCSLLTEHGYACSK
jgi:hypothetical protein